MSEDCTHSCGSCAKNCKSRTEKNQFLAEMNEYSDIRHVYGVVSGKGGVGKSLITSLLAAAMCKKGYSTAVLDADITGPSIPRAFGIRSKALVTEEGMYPVVTENGIEVMSLNLINENESDPVVWRGPVIAGVVRQFWTDVRWGDIDYMFVDMPPGTGDVPLTVFQSLPIEGVIVVTSPQDLVSMIVTKAVRMAELMNVPVIGMVENYSYVECPDCGKHIEVFGPSKIDALSKELKIDTIAKLPLKKEIAELLDAGRVIDVDENYIKTIIDRIEAMD